MARKRTITACALNIEMPSPHSPERYIQLLMAAFKLRRAIRVRGDQHLVLSSVDRPNSEEKTLTGTFSRFTEINMELPWFDVQTLGEASEDATQEIVIPDNLRPNFTAFDFVMYGVGHKFIFEQSGHQITIGPRQVLKFFQLLFDDSKIISNFGSVTVSLIQIEQALNEILSLEQLRWLKIEYQPPNPDDHASLEARMKAKLRAERAKRVSIEYVADSSGSLKPGHETKSLARSALSHGKLTASGYNDKNEHVTLSSELHPLREVEKYDPETLTEKQAFHVLAQKMTRSLRAGSRT